VTGCAAAGPARATVAAIAVAATPPASTLQIAFFAIVVLLELPDSRPDRYQHQ
jgi:hypothetical protein